MFKVNNKDNRTMPMALTIKLTIKTVNQGQIQATQTFSLQYKDKWKYCPVIFRNLFFPNLKRLLQVLWEHFYDKFSKFFKSSIIWQKFTMLKFLTVQISPFQVFFTFYTNVDFLWSLRSFTLTEILRWAILPFISFWK